jgi:hypothetical protein
MDPTRHRPLEVRRIRSLIALRFLKTVNQRETCCHGRPRGFFEVQLIGKRSSPRAPVPL